MTDLTVLTPAEVDTPLAELYERIYDARADLYLNRQRHEQYMAGVEKCEAGDFRYSGYSRDDKYLTRLDDEADKLRDLINDLTGRTVPYENEYVRRGGWTRAWLVDNTNGHVHNTMQCSTCYPTTRFGWLPQVSGMTEDGIVELAGEKACTVCYPSAPAEVLNNPSALELPRRREERLAREAERAEKQAAKAAKSLSLDGSVVEVRWLYGEGRRGWKDIKTYRAAELFVVEALSRPGVVNYDVPTPEVLDEVIDLMATKRGVTRDGIVGPLKVKADKKRKQRVW